MKLTATIAQNGFQWDDRYALAICLREYMGKAVTVDVEPLRKTRTLKQNARHWAHIVPMAQHELNRMRPGLLPLNRDQVHALLVTAFLGSEETELGPVPMRTRDLTTEQFAHMDDQAERWLIERGWPVDESGNLLNQSEVA